MAKWTLRSLEREAVGILKHSLRLLFVWHCYGPLRWQQRLAEVSPQSERKEAWSVCFEANRKESASGERGAQSCCLLIFSSTGREAAGRGRVGAENAPEGKRCRNPAADAPLTTAASNCCFPLTNKGGGRQVAVGAGACLTCSSALKSVAGLSTLTWNPRPFLG